MKKALIASVLLAAAACSEDDTRVRLYYTQDVAPGMSASEVEALNTLGPTLLEKGVNFSVYSENATRIDLMLFDDPESEQATRQFEMKRFGDVWNLYVEGVGVGQHYGYIAWGANWEVDKDWYPGTINGYKTDVDSNGNRFNPNKLLLDPYAKAIHRDHDWSKGSTASGPGRTQSTLAAAAKSVVVESSYEWSEEAKAYWEARQNPQMEGHRPNDLIIYEVHLKGLSADPASGVSHPGTYRGAAEMAPYLKELGVTAVEFLPIHEKPLDGGYWGYNNLSFFAPEISFSSTKDPLELVDEFKAMVDTYHQHGIEVIIDVVYNHTGEGGLWREKLELNDTTFDSGTQAQLGNFDPYEVAGLYSFRGLDNAAYYALSADGLTYWNNTGVGNQTRTNHAPMRKLIIDSLRYYVEEMHVDGFRFDLAPILGEKDRFYNEWDAVDATVLQDIIDDPVLKKYNTRVIAEPWSIQGFYLGQFPKASNGENAWGEWNAHFRDWWRSFVNEDGFRLNSREGIDGGGVMTGSFDVFGDDGRKPYHSMNFITVHDGFTMYDLVSYNEKQNKCGPLNPVCCDSPLSAWCDKNSGEDHNRSRDWGDEATKRQMMRNFFVAMLTAHGTPMLYGGDEWMRTQLGNNNAYSTQADNPANWFEWGKYKPKDEANRMHDFVKQLIRLRKEHAYAFAPSEYGEAVFAWKSAQNTDAVAWDSRQVMMHYYDVERGPELLVLINMERGDVSFTLPEGRTWKRLLDTQAYFDKVDFLGANADDLKRSYNITLDDPEVITSADYGVTGSSIVILKAE
ncbi:MAG: alpha-amylase family glycosyl hydrolase [bacterium]